MLRLFMFRYVFQECSFFSEALVAAVTFVRFVCLMAARMRLKIGELRKGLVAVGIAALVGLVAGVSPDVLLEMRKLGELAMADLATVRLDAEMDAGVLRQVRRVGKCLGALGALVRFGITHVNLSV